MFKIHHCHPRMGARARHRQAGFSLMEIMVVIVIVLVLVAVLVPVTRNMRERAKSAQCVQNLRQIGIGLHAYIAESGGRFPNGRAHVSWLKDDQQNSLGISWYDAAANGMGRSVYSMQFKDPKAEPLPEAFGCPSGHGKAYHPEWPYTGDYAANLLLGNDNAAANPKTIASVKNPSATPYVQDTNKQNNFGAWIYASGAEKVDAGFAARHAGKGNILWVDGHVSALSYEEYMKRANSARFGGPTNFMRGNW